MSKIISTITASSSPGYGYYQPERKTESDRTICQACPYKQKEWIPYEEGEQDG